MQVSGHFIRGPSNQILLSPGQNGRGRGAGSGSVLEPIPSPIVTAEWES